MRVVEHGDSIALRLCGKLLADAGATVSRLPLAADPLLEPPYGPDWVAFLDAGKAGGGAADGLLANDGLLAAADLYLTSLAHDAPLGCTAVLARYPRLTAACVPALGQDGPAAGLAADEVVLAALSGLADATPGLPDHVDDPTDPPVQSLAPFAEMAGGLAAAVAVVGALLPRLRGEPGPRHVEAAAIEAVTAMMAYEWGITANGGGARGRRPFPLDPAPNLYLPTSDGTATVVAFSKPAWASLVELMGSPEWALSADFAHPRSRAQHLDRLEPLLAEWLSRQRGHDFMVAAQAHGMPCGCSFELAETLADPHLRAVEAVAEENGRLVPSDPIRVDGARRRRPTAAAPPPTLGPAVAGAPAPLAGIRVVDFGQFVAGPWCGQLLASLGAEVILVEPPGLPASRALGPFAGEPRHDASAMFNVVNRGKRSVRLDMKTPEGHAAALALVERADVVVENFSRAAAEKLGLTFERLSALRPEIVVASVSGFGRSGPWGGYVGLHSTVLLLSGVASVTRDPAGRMRLAGAIYPDLLAGTAAALAVLEALAQRARTGQGGHVEVAMLDVLLTCMGGLVPAAGRGERFGPNTHACFLPTAEPGAYVAASGQVDDALRAEVARLGRPAAAARLQAAGLRAAPVLDMSEVQRDPHLLARGFVYEEAHPVAGLRPAAGVPWRYDGARARVGPAPCLGEGTEEILGVLGIAAGDA